MTILATASSLGQDSSKFHEKVVAIIDDQVLSYDEPLDRHLDTPVQAISYIFDTRKFNDVVLSMAEDIHRIYSNHYSPREHIVIISHSSGSRLVEEALTIVNKKIDNLPIEHIMISPSIKGSEWAKVGSLVSSFIGGVITGEPC